MAKIISNLNKSQKEIINDEMDERNVVSSSELIEDVDFNLGENIIDRIEALEQGAAGSEELLTSNKTIVGAINELFQNVDSGKQLIAGAIGDSSITKDSTFQAMSNAIAGRVKPAGTAVASNVLSGKTFINSTGQTITGTMANKAANTACVSTATNSTGTLYVRIPQGAYVTNSSSGYPTIDVVDADFISSNIVSGKNIFGVTGTASTSMYPVWYDPQNTWMQALTAQLTVNVNSQKYVTSIGDNIYIFNKGSYCVYNAKTNTCSASTSYTNLPSTSELSRGDFSVVALNNLIYFVGGLKSYSNDRQNANNYLMVFNPSDKSWTTKANMITALNQAAVCTHDNKIYVFGGRTYKEYYSGNYLYGYSTKCSSYNPTTNTWTAITDLPKYKSAGIVKVVNNCAYVVSTGGDVMARYKYDFSTGTYSEITSGLTGSYGYTVYKNRIYQFNTTTAKMYDTLTGTETDKTVCPVDKSDAVSQTIGDLIYFIGGFTKNSNGYYNNSYKYGSVYIPEK